MTKKTQTPVESQNQPKVLGMLVIASGAFSTWYWYKPLPPEAGQAAYANWDHGQSVDSLWTDAGLIRPSLEELQEVTPKSLGASLETQNLQVSQSGLIPAPPIKWKLDSLLSKDPLPTSPEIDIAQDTIVGPLKPWVETDDPLPATAVAKHHWPDNISSDIASTSPFSSQPQKTGATQPPPFLDVASKKIRTFDEEEIPKIPPHQGTVPFEPTTPRIPQFIRQPRK